MITVIETSQISQVIEAGDEQQAQEVAEILANDGDILAWADTIDMELSFDVRRADAWQSTDYDKYDVKELLGE